ncbi:MAG: hypothetical protein QM817_28250 [Archangium sp.]
MRLVFLVLVMSGSAAFALPGEQVSKLTLGAEEAAKTLTAPPPPLTPLPPSAFGAASMGEPLSVQLRLRLIAMELRSLRFQKNDLVGPVMLTILGGSGSLIGLTLLGVATTGGYTAMIVGLIMLMVSGGPLLIGLPWLIVALNHNALIEREMDKLELERTSLGVSLRDVTAPEPAAMVARF